MNLVQFRISLVFFLAVSSAGFCQENDELPEKGGLIIKVFRNSTNRLEDNVQLDSAKIAMSIMCHTDISESFTFRKDESVYDLYPSYYSFWIEGPNNSFIETNCIPVYSGKITVVEAVFEPWPEHPMSKKERRKRKEYAARRNESTKMLYRYKVYRKE